MIYNEIKGDLIQLALENKFDVIAHGVNCFCVQKSGLAPKMVNIFNTDKFPMESERLKGDINKLGQIDGKTFLGKYNTDPTLTVLNAYTQYYYGKNHSDGVDKPLDYEALTLCLRKINTIFKGKHIGLPKIGCGLARGDWNIVKKIIKEELKDCKVTIVIYE